MANIVSKHYYYGIPEEKLGELESVAQATLEEMFKFSKQVYEDSNIKLWNCSVYRSQVRPDAYNDALFNRLLIINHACSYWAVIEFGQPSFANLPQYTNSYDFSVFSTLSDNKHVNSNSIDWRQLEEEWSYDRAHLFWRARKLKDSWYAPVHTINFKYPLLHLLRNGCSESD